MMIINLSEEDARYVNELLKQAVVDTEDIILGNNDEWNVVRKVKRIQGIFNDAINGKIIMRKIPKTVRGVVRIPDYDH